MFRPFLFVLLLCGLTSGTHPSFGSQLLHIGHNPMIPDAGFQRLHDSLLESTDDNDDVEALESDWMRMYALLRQPILQMYAPTSDEVANKLCRTHSQIYVEKLKTLTTPWAIRMFDSATKFPDGFLQGNVMFRGNFDECVEVEAVIDDEYEVTERQFQGKYCLSKFRLTPPTPPPTRPPEEGNRFGFTYFPWIEWSFCIPSSCSHQDLLVSLQNQLNFSSILGGWTLEVKVDPLTCQIKDQWYFLDVYDIIMVVLLSTLAALVVTSTLYDFVTRETPEGRRKWKYNALNVRNENYVAFSLITNGQQLLSTRTTADTLECLNGIRFLSICWVILGHTYINVERQPWINTADMPRRYEELLRMTLNSGPVAVDSFFFISGLLLMYLFSREMDRTNGRFKIHQFYILRYLRITPPYALVMAFAATLYKLWGSGPAWSTVASAYQDNCRHTWMYNMAYINNYNFLHLYHECLGQSWYLAVDMQLYLVSPLIIYPLWRWTCVGFTWLVSLTIGCIGFVFYLIFRFRFQPTDEDVYARFYTRACPYLIGIALGYYFHKTKGRKIELNRKWVVAGWIMSTVICLVVVYGPYNLFLWFHRYDIVEVACYCALHRFAWSIGLAWIVFACVTGHGGPVNKLLSHKVFIPLGRISYSMYLTHMFAVSLKEGTTRYPGYLSDLNMMYTYAGNLALTIMLAIVLFLVCEAPCQALLRTALKTHQRDGKKYDKMASSDSEDFVVSSTNGTRKRHLVAEA